MKLIVTNTKVVSEYLGFPIKLYEDLGENAKCKNFIKENELYFNSLDQQDFLDFYHKTGIILEHEFANNGYKRFNLFGLVEKYPYKIYTAHLIIIDDENNIKIENDILYLNDKKVRNIKDEVNKQKDKFQKFAQFNERLQDILDNSYYYGDFETNKNELIKYSEDYYPDYKEIENTKQLVITPYNDVLTLTNDGTLYCNDKAYRTNVDYIFEENIINKIAVYKNNSIECITVNFGGPLSKKCDKILCNNNCLALLKEKNLDILIKSDEYITNKSHVVSMQGIDDIEFSNWDEDEIEISVGKQKIIFSLLNNHIHDVDL